MKTVVSGVLLLDKPTGLSSHSALAQAKRLLMSPEHDSKKAGHTGTLDPMATGLLPICFGEATKFSAYGLDADKRYQAHIYLGVQTDTGDKEGEVVARAPVPAFSDAVLVEVAARFLGARQQLPPMYSALKKDGKKLYEYARQGITVERSLRDIHIQALTLTKQDANTLLLDVSCSKGTYVRVLAEELAEALGTLGHLVSLRRLTAGGMRIMDALTLDALAHMPLAARLQQLLPVDALVAHLPSLAVTSTQAERLMLGQRLNVKDQLCERLVACRHPQMVRLYAHGVFIGLGELSMHGRLQPKRLIGR